VPSQILHQAQNSVTTPPQDNDYKAMQSYLQNTLTYFKDYQTKQNKIIDILNRKFYQMEQEKNSLSQECAKLHQENALYLQNINKASKDLQDLRQKNNLLEQEKSSLSQECAKLRQESTVLQQRQNTYKEEIDKLNNKNRQIEQEKVTISQQCEQYKKEKETYIQQISKLSEVSNPNNNTITEFNTWSSNPINQLPANFKYIKGVIKARSEQLLEESVYETNWISNRDGGKIYLFPNPRIFDELTDIREVYKITGTLKSKGQNKIRITKPCEIGDKGYINYPGELQIL
jgi:DNA repair exonuclease SbcCD ATPase subunit